MASKITKNIILGGGLIGLLARDILGSDWSILPIGRSLFYSTMPPLADNFIIADNDNVQYLSKFSVLPVMRKVGYSFGGELVFNSNLFINDFMNKLYGPYVPPQAPAYWRNRNVVTTYGNCCEIYRRLQSQYKDEILQNNQFGIISKIDDHAITAANGTIEYDRVISTIPLYALLDYTGLSSKYNLKSNSTWYYHVRTESLDIEGADIVYIIDSDIEFKKVTKFSDVDYVFESNNQIDQPAQYLMAMIDKFEMIAETHIDITTPCGPIPTVYELDDYDIATIGSLATWDDCLDVGSCIKRLTKYGS